jgi:hypothetical protein
MEECMGLSICCINSTLSEAFQELGHDVLDLRPKPGIFDLQEELRQRNVSPDFVFQQETLGPRVLIRGLGEIQCPRIYWSIDTHLNSFWQGFYGRLFDLVLTTQKKWVPVLKRCGVGEAGWLPWYGTIRPFRPHSERDLPVTFVGRVTRHRELRRWFTTFLSERYPFTHAQEVPYHEMLGLYDRSRIVPNESIFGEINFRTFEAASCGCAIVGPDVGDAISELFRSGEEHLSYGNVLELQEHVDRLLDDRDGAARLGHAARERVIREHLPAHRAGQVLALIRTLPRGSRRNDDRDWLLALHGLALRGEHLIRPDKLERALSELPATPESLSALIQIRAGDRSRTRVMEMVLPLLHREQYEAELSVNVAGSTACLAVDEWSFALQFWMRHLRSGITKGRERPDSPEALYLLWARELAKVGRKLRTGLKFSPSTHLPETALECLFAAHGINPENLQTIRRMDDLASGVSGMESLRMQMLSHVSLHERNNWRLGLELALVNFGAYRVREGLEELQLAFTIARERGMEESFFRVLGAKDPSGRLRRALQNGIRRVEVKGNA